MSADLSQFDPNSVGLKTNNIFGLPFSIDQSALVLLPVPWEVTVSYRNGTARGPENIFKESLQIDLYDADVPDAWKNGYYMLAEDKNIRKFTPMCRVDYFLPFRRRGCFVQPTIGGQAQRGE